MSHPDSYYRRRGLSIPSRAAVSEPEKPEPKPPFLIVLLRFLGFGLIVAGLGIMELRFWVGVILVWIGFAAMIWEVCKEPSLIKGSLRIQVALIGVVIFFFDWFTISIVLLPMPLELRSYAMRKGNYAPDAVIAGIPWDVHLTDARVAITNSVEDDYRDLDFRIRFENIPVYKAAVVDFPWCDVTPIDSKSVVAIATAKESGPLTFTGTRTGGTFDVHDSSGNVYTKFLYPDGYRLICSKLPSHMTVQVVLALGRMKNVDQLMPHMPEGKWGFQVTELGKVNSKFDLLEARPNPSLVIVEGKYSRGPKSLSVTRKFPVMDGN